MSINRPPSFRRLSPSEIKGNFSVKISEITDEDKAYAIAMYLARNPQDKGHFGEGKSKQLLDSYGRPLKFKEKSKKGSETPSSLLEKDSSADISNTVSRDFVKANELDLSKGVLLKGDGSSNTPASENAADRFRAVLLEAKKVI